MVVMIFIIIYYYYSRYADCFTESSKYFQRDLRLLKSMYGMTNCGNLSSDQLTEWLLYICFIQYQYQISIYYKYAPDGTKIVVLSYVDDCVYCYNSEALVKLFVDDLEDRFRVNFLGYAHWFMSIIISHMKYHSIYVEQARSSTSTVAKYLDTITVNKNTKFC